MAMLSLDGVDVFIQASHILRRISLEVGEREVACLVGRNGAGKTTTLRTVMGYLRPRAGRIQFRGHDIEGLRTYEIARRGLGFAPEDAGIFPDLTVATTSASARMPSGVVSARTRPWWRATTRSE